MQPLATTSIQLSTRPSSRSTTMMCDACGGKIGIISKKMCGDCHLNFCSSCVQQRPPKGPYICQKCKVFSHGVMERTHLEGLRDTDLQYFTRLKAITTPAGVSHNRLVDIILDYQAKVLSEQAKKALAQVQGSVDGVNETMDETDAVIVDGLNQGQESSVDRVGRLPESGQTGQTSQAGNASGASVSHRGGLESVEKRSRDEMMNPESKRIKEDFDIASVMNLDDLEEESQINGLSVKQLKIILKRNCLDYKDCVEKQELLDRVKRLWQAREKGKEMEALLAAKGDHQAESDFLCKVCMDAPVDCVLLECGHMLACVTCGRQLAECPVCRQLVVRAVHAFKV